MGLHPQNREPELPTLRLLLPLLLEALRPLEEGPMTPDDGGGPADLQSGRATYHFPTEEPTTLARAQRAATPPTIVALALADAIQDLQETTCSILSGSASMAQYVPYLQRGGTEELIRDRIHHLAASTLDRLNQLTIQLMEIESYCNDVPG